MDEKELLAEAAEELFEGQGADEAIIELRKQSGEQFPVILFMLNVLKDLLGDPAIDLMQPFDMTGLLAVLGISAYVFYNLCFSLPLWVWNFLYVRKKISNMVSITRWTITGKGTGLGKVTKKYREQVILRFGGMFLGSLVPFLNFLLLQSTLVLFAHYRHNKIVKGILAGFEAFGEVIQAGGNPAAAMRVAEEYAGRAAAKIVRRANVSGRIGNRYGERARASAQRLEQNVVRVARARAGEAAGLAAQTSQRGGPQGAAGPEPRRAGAAEAIRREALPPAPRSTV